MRFVSTTSKINKTNINFFFFKILLLNVIVNSNLEDATTLPPNT